MKPDLENEYRRNKRKNGDELTYYHKNLEFENECDSSQKDKDCVIRSLSLGCVSLIALQL